MSDLGSGADEGQKVPAQSQMDRFRALTFCIRR
jgi:hypothetical protein